MVLVLSFIGEVWSLPIFISISSKREKQINSIKRSSREKQRNDYSNIDEENELLFHFFHLLYMPNGRIEVKEEENKDMIFLPLGLGPGSISQIFSFFRKRKHARACANRLEMKISVRMKRAMVHRT